MSIINKILKEALNSEGKNTCSKCGRNCDESYFGYDGFMCNDAIWRELGFAKDEFVCWDCFREKMEWQLNSPAYNDFSQYNHMKINLLNNNIQALKCNI